MKVLTIGGATIDTIAIIESDRIERMSMRNADSSFLLLEEGGKTEALEVSTHCGGGASNAAVAFSRLGFDAAALVKLGNDRRAEIVVEKLEREGVSVSWVRRDARVPTGASVLISSHDRNAAIFTFRGANTLLEESDLVDDAFAVDLVYIANLSNQSATCFPAILHKAKENGALVAANPGVRQLSSHSAEFLACLPEIDILLLNRPEADALVAALVPTLGEGGGALSVSWGQRPPRLAIRGLIGGGFEMSLRAFFRGMRERGPGHVIVTDGREGAFSATGDKILYAEPVQTAVAGTAGAGDAFGAAYAAYVAFSRSAEDALSAASVNAASVLGYVDTQSGLLNRVELEKRLGEQLGRQWAMSWPL
jgi:ribokinase